MGELLDFVAEQGLSNNTVIALHGDHGFHLGLPANSQQTPSTAPVLNDCSGADACAAAGEHNHWGKETNFELSTRVPLIIKAAPGTAPSLFVVQSGAGATQADAGYGDCLCR